MLFFNLFIYFVSNTSPLAVYDLQRNTSNIQVKEGRRNIVMEKSDFLDYLTLKNGVTIIFRNSGNYLPVITAQYQRTLEFFTGSALRLELMSQIF